MSDKGIPEKIARKLFKRLPLRVRKSILRRVALRSECEKKIAAADKERAKNKAEIAALKVKVADLGEVRANSKAETEALKVKVADLEEQLFRRRVENVPVGRPPLTAVEVRAEIAKVGHWYHRIQVAPGIFTPGDHDSPRALETMEIPDDLSGSRVLDIGARDGFFSFVGEDRGAEVLAVDAVAPHLTGFETAAKLMVSNVEYKTMNVYDLAPESVGEFDMIFFLGVLYHLRDPMLALDKIWSVAKPGAMIWVESHIIDHGLIDPATGKRQILATVAPNLVDVPVAQFYPGNMLGGSTTNWWAPNMSGLKSMVESAGFSVERSLPMGERGLVVARKIEDENTNFFRWYDRSVINEKEYLRA